MKTLAKNLRAAADQLELPDAEIARRAGLSPRRYGNYVEGTREPDFVTFVKICQVLGKTPNDLLEIKGCQHLPPSMIRISSLDVRVSGGGGAVVDREDEDGHFGFPRGEFDVPPDRLRIITVIGDSMYKPGDPSSLQPGDRVIVDTGQRAPSPPGIFVLFDGIGLVVKRLEPVPARAKRVRVLSLNAGYSPYELAAAEVHIQGRVIGVWRRM